MIPDVDVWIRANTRALPPAPSGSNLDDLTACRLDDVGAEWAGHLRLPSSTFARRAGEPDPDYRPRLLALIRAARSRSLS